MGQLFGFGRDVLVKICPLSGSRLETLLIGVVSSGQSSQKLRQAKSNPDERWHLDEMVISVAGLLMYMWRVVDSEGEVLDILLRKRRDKIVALKLLGKLFKK
jgi:transposase-like protein